MNTTAPVVASRPEPDILLLTLNRPQKRNAVTGEMIRLLEQYLDEASVDKTIRAIVVTGNPQGKAFCAGADLSPGTGMNQAEGPRVMPAVADFRDEGGYSSLAALRCTKPIIAAINGASVGWGLAVTLAMDIRVVSEDAKVGFTMAARGLVNESCSSWLLPRLVGAGVAKELVFTARVMKAKDAPSGLFNHIVAKEQVLPKALDIAREIASTSSGMSVATCKFLMNEGWETTPEESMLMESEALHHVSFIKKEDLREGFSSFLEKRRPNWKLDSWEDLPRFVRSGLSARTNVRPLAPLKGKSKL